MAEDQTDTYRQVFGGDDSDLSDEEVQQPRVQQQQSPRRSPSASRSRSRSVTPARSGDGGEYVPATETSAAKYPKFKKTAGKRRQTEGDEPQPRRAKKKRVRRERESGDEGHEEEEEAPVVYDEATLKRMALDAKFESIGKKATGKKRKSKKNQDDDLDAMHDEEINRLRDTMLDAAYQDEEANRARKPATHKLEMLDQVTAILQNSTLGQSIIDNGLLTAVTAWLKPLPDKSLPALGIQKAFFEVLPKMDIDTATLKECRLGPIVDFYTKTKRVPPSISRSANQLYDTWYRLVTGRSASLRQKPVRDTEVDDEPLAERGERGERARTNRRFNAEQATEENKGRKGATLPRTTQTRYTLAPVPKTQHHAEDLEHVTRLQQDNRKFNKFKSAKGRAAR